MTSEENNKTMRNEFWIVMRLKRGNGIKTSAPLEMLKMNGEEAVNAFVNDTR